MKKITWLIIANAVKANIYEIADNTYSLFKALEHSDSRLKSQQLTCDGPGHYQTDKGNNGQFSLSSDAHKQEQVYFAKEIANFLQKNHEGNRYQHIILCAEPHFYGLLNQALSPTIKKIIIKIIEKDYIPFPTSKLNTTIEAIIHEHF